MAARGFSLIEVLVALTIMALAFAALLRVSGIAADNSGTLQSRMRAGWVAENRLAWLRARSQTLAAGITRGRLEEDGRRWDWEQTVTPAAEPGLWRVEIRIVAPGDARYTLAGLSGWLPRRPP